MHKVSFFNQTFRCTSQKYFNRRAYSTIFNHGAEKRIYHHHDPFKTEFGETIPHLKINWEEWGSHNDRVVLVCPSLSVGSHAHSTIDDPSPGWWEGMIGPGHSAGIDTDHFRVICPSNIGAPYGSTSPSSIDPVTCKRYGISFPQLTPRDIARAHALLLNHLHVPSLHAVIGSSLGGMVALSFAAEYPDLVQRLCAISGTGRSSPGSVALRSVQRHAILSDPNYQNGEYYDSPKKPMHGMMTARQLGMITYRSLEEFNQRFNWTPFVESPHWSKPAFEVEQYLQSKAEAFAKNFDPNCFLLLSKCSDLMDLGRGFKNYSEGVLRIGSSERVSSRTLLIGADQDLLIPLGEQRRLAELLSAHGRQVHFRSVPSIYGHDAFLLDELWFVPRIRAFLDDQKIPMS